MQVASLHIHPLKSCAALDVDTLDIEPRGPAHDRRWLLVDARGRFLTARAEAQLVRLRATPLANGIRIEAPGGDSLVVAIPEGHERIEVRIWDDRVVAALADPAAHAWLGAALGRDVRLVYMDERARRAVDPRHSTAGDEVSFADGYPVLAIARASLDALNVRLAAPVPMARFRPNLVLEGCAAHAEDGWRRVRIGDIEFEAVNPCKRCVFTTLDPATATRDPDGEPLATLRTYRAAPDGAGVLFGKNLTARGTGTLRRGDPVSVLELQ